MSLHELQPQIDYFYCDQCEKHVPCVRLEPGVWEVQCPRCVGECGLCGCHLAGYCFGRGNAPVKTHMYVVASGGKTSQPVQNIAAGPDAPQRETRDPE